MAHPCIDYNMKTCIEIARDDENVSYIPLLSRGLYVQIADLEDFDVRFKSMTTYPVEKAARMYLQYSKSLGATKEVMVFLSKLTTISENDIEVAVKQLEINTRATEDFIENFYLRRIQNEH